MFLSTVPIVRSLQYMQWLQSLGVIASEMEASMLFTLASTYSGEPVSVGKAAGASQVLAGTGACRGRGADVVG